MLHEGQIAVTTPAALNAAEAFGDVLAGLLGVAEVPADSHFFDDLGANSLMMAHFCARVRKREDLPSVSIKDIYAHPTLSSLAAAVDDAPVSTAPAVPPPAVVPGSTTRFVVCGAVQAAVFLAYSYLAAVLGVVGYQWIAAASGLVETYLRSVAAGGAAVGVVCAVPVVVKWVLIGRWKAGEFPVWGAAYLRFWVVKSLLHANPIVLFAGNPLYVLYLRALGARIGKGVTILSPSLPVCTDLITIGEGSIIRKDSFLLGYRAVAGRIQTGSVTLGRQVYVGEKTVLDIDTAMGDGSQLGHTSSLQRGQAVPSGERWHGSPAEATHVDYARVPAADCGTARRALFAVASLLRLLLVTVPLVVGAPFLLVVAVPSLHAVVEPDVSAFTSGRFYLDCVVVSLVLFGVFLVVGLAVVLGVPRLLSAMVRPDRVYPLYGLHYSLHRSVARITNVKFFTWLFGNSSYVVPWLRGLGYDLSGAEQTGSNFGTEVGHETPYLTSVGRGTMVADGLSVVNADYSSTSFRLSRASIGAHNFLGNNIAYPAGGRTGDNCLLATKVMVPLDGPVRHDVGLLGSPSFEIPRTVERDTRFDRFRTGAELQRRLGLKNRHNLRTMALFLVVRWVHVLLLTVLGLLAVDGSGLVGGMVAGASLVLGLVLSAAWFVLVERAIALFRPLQPRLCSIYDPYFWWHERLWKVPDAYLNAFNGTPFKNLVWRLLGVRLGRRVFDDGCYVTERTLTAIGDDCTLNVGSKMQCHSQEDGTFKSDRSTLAAGCTLGVGAFVHYGVTMGDGAELAADSFLMKGEDVPAHARWQGNPATEARR